MTWVRAYIEHPTLYPEKSLTVTSQLSEENVEVIEFQQLKDLQEREIVDSLVKNLGVVYVTSITRDGCSGCMEQKPLFQDLAQKMNSDLAERIHFANVHIRYEDNDKAESWESKRVFRHAAYPTYLVHVRSKNGVLEVYRAIYPKMDELEKQARESLDLAKFYKDET
jgi:thiol-disulfide isomerase/thioredoxin